MVGFGVGLGVGVVGFGVGVVGVGFGVVGVGVVVGSVFVGVGVGVNIPDGLAVAPISIPTATETRDNAPINTWLDFLTRQTPLIVFGSLVFLLDAETFRQL